MRLVVNEEDLEVEILGEIDFSRQRVSQGGFGVFFFFI